MYSSMKHLVDDEIYSASEDTNISNDNVQKIKQVKSKSKGKRKELIHEESQRSESSAAAYENDGYHSDEDDGVVSNGKNTKDQGKYENDSSNSSQSNSQRKQHKVKDLHVEKTLITEDIQSEIVEENHSSFRLKLIGLYIHQLNNMKRHPYVNAFKFKIDIYNYNNGKCLNNQEDNKPQIQTHVWRRSHQRYCEHQWNELIIFEKSMIRLLEENDKIIIFFQLYKIKDNPKDDSAEEETDLIAWSFLKYGENNNNYYINKKLKLQMYEPSDQGESFKVYNCWKNTKWKVYPGTMDVTIKGHKINRDDEYLNTIQCTAHSFVNRHKEKVSSRKNKNANGLSNCSDKYVRRNKHETSQVFNHVSECIQYGGKECFVMRFSRNGHYLAFATKLDDSYIINVVKVPCFTQCAKLTKHKNIIYDISWNHTDDILISASSDSTMCIWEVNESRFKLIQQVNHKSFVYSAQFSESPENIIATGCFDKLIRVWKINEETKCDLLQELDGHEGFINAICFAKQSKALYSGDSVGAIIKWNCDNNEWHQLLVIKSSEIRNHIINDIVMFPNSHKLLIVLRNSVSWALDTSTSTLIHCYRDGINCRYQTRGCISPCGSLILIGNCIWNSTTAQLLAIYNPQVFHNQMITAVSCHPHYDITAVACGFTQSPVLICTSHDQHQEKGLNMEVYLHENDNIMEHLSGNKKNDLQQSTSRIYWKTSDDVPAKEESGRLSGNNEIMHSFKLRNLINKMDMAISKVKKVNKSICEEGKSDAKDEERRSPAAEECEDLKIDIRSQNSDGTYTVENEINNDASTLSEAESIVTYTVSPKHKPVE